MDQYKFSVLAFSAPLWPLKGPGSSGLNVALRYSDRGRGITTMVAIILSYYEEKSLSIAKQESVEDIATRSQSGDRNSMLVREVNPEQR